MYLLECRNLLFFFLGHEWHGQVPGDSIDRSESPVDGHVTIPEKVRFHSFPWGAGDESVLGNVGYHKSELIRMRIEKDGRGASAVYGRKGISHCIRMDVISAGDDLIVPHGGCRLF